MVLHPHRILAQHPHGKKGTSIDSHKYHLMKTAIMQSLKKKSDLNQAQLLESVNQHLKDKFRGSISSYMENVKLDLISNKQVAKVQPHASSPALYHLLKGKK
jgi:hypothetical protein